MHPHSDNSKTDFISESLKQEGGWGGGGQNVTCSKTQSRHDKDRWTYFIYFYLWFPVTNDFSSSVLWQPTVFPAEVRIHASLKTAK